MEGHFLDSVTVAQVLEKENLRKAWKQVRANKGSPGVDNMTIDEFPEYAFRHQGESRPLFRKGPVYLLQSKG
jgi:RNA-directed DNA polymerase